MILSRGVVPYLDRLGSNRNGSKYFPYGQEQTVTAQDKDKFATYYRDNTTGLDYANQRYYASTLGRFTSPDPYKASGGTSDPGSWNRYAYVGADPANRFDPKGTCWMYPGDPNTYPNTGLDPCVPEDDTVYYPPDAAPKKEPASDQSVRDSLVAIEKARSERLFASLQRLAKNMTEECAHQVGAGDKATVIDRLLNTSAFTFSIGYADLGALRYDENGRALKSSGPYAQYKSGFIFREIRLNSAINWEDPTKQPGFFDGRLAGFNLAAKVAESLSIDSITANQFMDLAILHEISHSFGNYHPEDDSRQFNRDIWADCFK